MGRTDRLSSLDRLVILRDISVGVSFLHAQRVCHLDLNPSKIFISSPIEWTPMIGGFGCAEVVSICAPTTRLCGTPAYTAPEIMLLEDGESYSGEAADVYSFAITCFEVLTGMAPFAGISSPLQLITDVAMRNERPKLPDHIPGSVRSLVSACWDPDPCKRPQMAEVTVLLNAAVRDAALYGAYSIRECIICMGEPIACIFPCLHAVACAACGSRLLGSTCPVCREPVTKVVNVPSASIAITLAIRRIFEQYN